MTCTSGDNEYMMTDDPTLPTVRPKIVCAISELRDQQPTTTTTTLTSTDFDVLDELTEELVVSAVQRLLNVPPLSLCRVTNSRHLSRVAAVWNRLK